MLGGLRVTRAGQSTSRFTPKVGALLGYLALHPGLQPREQLIEQFWPDMEIEAGRDNLSTSLVALRRQLEPPGIARGAILIANHSQVGLNSAALATDVAEFERLVDEAAGETTAERRANLLTSAIDLYRGDLLPGYYQDWAIREMERLQGRLIEALDRLAGDQERLGNTAAAVEITGRRLVADPYSEEVHASYVRRLLAAGRPAAARDAYSRFSILFEEEFGAPPNREICQAIERMLQKASPTDFNVLSGPGARAAGRSAIRRQNGAGARAESRVETEEIPQPAAPPVWISRLFGRQNEMARLSALLMPAKDAPGGPEGTPGACRLVTITGAGGVGKTRLAAEFARVALERGGLWCAFVSLADVEDQAEVLPRIAQALRLAPPPGSAPSETFVLNQIVGFLRERDYLSGPRPMLIMDNLEHLLSQDRAEGAVATTILDLMERVPSLTCLCTSRRRIGLQGEQLLPLDLLPVPEPARDRYEPADLADLLENPSVRLYVDRAQAVRPDFGLTTANAAPICALCRQLEGSPLGLELAAAWVRMLPPRKMWERLTQGQDLPEGRYADLPSRHLSLSATLDWSFRLLTPVQQRLFTRLWVFRGGWTLPLCAAVSGEPEVLTLLADLQEASLVSSEETEAGDVRYGLLDTVRTFSRQQAENAHRYGQAANGEGAPSEIRRRHAECFLSLAQEADSHLQGPEQADWLEQLETEHDNLRVALDRCLDEPDLAQTGLLLATALARFWIVRGHWQEGRRRFYALLARYGASAPETLRARAHLGAGMLANITRDFERAHSLFAEALALFRALGDRAGEAETLHQDAYAAVRQGVYEPARPRYEEALSIYREIGNGVGIADELHHLGLVAQQQRDYVTACRLYEESLAVRRPLGDLRGLAYTLHNLSKIAMRDGDLKRADELLEESLSIRRRLGDRLGIAESADNLATVAWRQGDEMRSRPLQVECLSLFRQLGDSVAIACALERFAAAAVARNQAVRAGSLYGAARAYWRVSGTRLPQPSAAERDEIIRKVLDGPDREIFQAAWNALEPLAPEEAAAQALES